ncbi:hypothetical protein [Mobilicoccus caccae]|uniref:Uncharacterized protein n=1 Tax=Mobilicoccus caccae TaxID=1859295 RepID=A0ABQ6IP25_9MICO|nr:hypothetical protein [Mobilicoccus caccae]GMA38983.1 hypothetical protein GCM10025883_10280 [Mobilicoccus caccae]
MSDASGAGEGPGVEDEPDTGPASEVSAAGTTTDTGSMSDDGAVGTGENHPDAHGRAFDDGSRPARAEDRR